MRRLPSCEASRLSRNSQHASAKFRVMQTAFAYSSVVLKPVRVDERRVIAELAVLVKAVFLVWG
jgi:hypothetical protein